MKPLAISNFLLGNFWIGWHRWAAWAICIGAIFLLGMLRKATEAEFAFASLALLPVLVIAWISGKWSGLFVAFLAAAMWAAGDIASGRQFDVSWIPWTNAVTRFVTYSMVALLAAQVRLLLEREHSHAREDALTGMQNRRAFLEAGAAEVERSKRYPHPLAVIFLDLDDFKRLNDTKGHDAGDAALCSAAWALRSVLRSSDQIARLGGDEFGILLPEIGYDAAIEAGRKISGAVNAVLEDFPPVGASVGVAWFEDSGRLFPAMLKAADELMYEVKESGKGHVRSRRFDAMSKPDSVQARSRSGGPER